MRTLAEIINKIKEFKKVPDDADVAILLGIKPKTLATAKSRNSLPFEELASFCSKEGISLDWLLTGEGEMRRPLAHEEPADRVGEELAIYNKVKGDLEMEEILSLLLESPQDKKLVLKFLKGKKDVKEALEGFGIKDILKEEEG